ncbi:MAG TPA: response regulator [Candidatus Paceibacterota bacterium]|nr:response regulator [Candidatus Paceibacterota bacterium]
MTDSSHILVVDDNQAAADALVRLMRALGSSAIAVYGPHEAIEHARKSVVQLAFVDIGMPDMDGHALIRILRNEGFEGPAFALSGYGGEDDRERAAEAGFTGHLTKPASMKDIKEVLDEYALA